MSEEVTQSSRRQSGVAPISRRAHAVLRFCMWGLAAAAASVVALLLLWPRSASSTGVAAAPEQPVPFDHRHHVRDDGIDCLYCHYEAEKGPSAGVPTTEECMGCHGQIWKDSPLLEPVRQSWFRGESIRWHRVYDVPDFVYFDHSIHVSRGVGCETCHGRVDRMGHVRKVHDLSMGWCLDCHRNPGPHLRPLDQITTMGFVPDEPRADLAARLVKQLGVRPSTDCSTCHR